MWILSFLPDWVFHLVLLAGIAGLGASFVLKFIPFISTYQLPIKVGALVLIIVGVWFEGAMSNQASWQARVNEMEAKVAAAEVKSANANTQIVTKVVTQIQVVKDTTNANQQYIKDVVAKDLDAQCKLTNDSVMLHNSASQNVVSGSTGGTAGGTSDVKASELLSTVTENYGTYYQVVEKLKGWQEWYKAQRAIFEEVK
jgi:hypothetical protein